MQKYNLQFFYTENQHHLYLLKQECLIQRWKPVDTKLCQLPEHISGPGIFSEQFYRTINTSLQSFMYTGNLITVSSTNLDKIQVIGSPKFYAIGVLKL